VEETFKSTETAVPWFGDLFPVVHCIIANMSPKRIDRFLLSAAGDTLSVSAEGNLTRPHRFSLDQNYPNPFNNSTVISYECGVGSEVRLSVYDVLGREVGIVVNGWKEAGLHRAVFDGSPLSAGVYLYRLQAAHQVFTRAMVLVP